MAQALRRGWRIAQESEVFAFRAEVLFELAPVEQAHVGILPFSKPLQHSREQDPVDLCGTGYTGGKRYDVAHGGVGVGESYGFETLMCGLLRQFDLLVIQAGIDRQHRAIVDVHVQVAYFAAGLVVFVDKFFRMQVEGTREPAQFEIPVQRIHIDVALALDAAETGVAKIREQMRAFQGPHLLPVFHHSFKAIVPGKFFCLLARHIPAIGQRLQRFQGGAGTQRFVGTTMHELEHLHGEFHITQTSATKLDLTIFERCRDKVFDSFAHLLTVIDEVVTFGCGPYERPGHVHISLAELGIARDGSRLEQRLEFPVLRPLLIVCLVRFESANERTVLAFGSQSTVDLPQSRFGYAHDHRLTYAL